MSASNDINKPLHDLAESFGFRLRIGDCIKLQTGKWEVQTLGLGATFSEIEAFIRQMAAERGITQKLSSRAVKA